MDPNQEQQGQEQQAPMSTSRQTEATQADSAVLGSEAQTQAYEQTQPASTAAATIVTEASSPVEGGTPPQAESPATTASGVTATSEQTDGSKATNRSSKLTGSKGTSKTGESTSKRNASPARSDRRQTGTPRRKRTKLGELDLASARIGFIGAGKMTESTVNGLINYAKIDPKRIHIAAPSTKNLEKFRSMGCVVTRRNYDIFARYDCDVIFLAFHGYVIKHCYKMGGTRPHPLTTNYIPHQRHPVYILSLVSGVSLAQIRACLLNPESTNRYQVEIHRIMMNTAVGLGLGICAIDCEPDSKKLSAPIRQLLSSFSHLEHVPASQMDAACAIGGSGLAFSYFYINALADGAFKMGLSRNQAIKFAAKTAQCAAQTMLESGKHPAELRDMVSSPSGAAIYGIHVLDKNDVASGVTGAVEAAHKRAHDLATQEVS